MSDENEYEGVGFAGAIIGDEPPAWQTDGHRWDNQCARCGSSVTYLCLRNEVIPWTCLSSPEWCQAHPLPGREDMARGEIEWFEDQEWY